MMITILGGNFPSLIIDSFKISEVYTLCIFFYNFIAGAFIFGYFAGGVGDNFKKQYVITLRKIAVNEPDIREQIINELKNKFFDPSSYEKVRRYVYTEKNDISNIEKESILKRVRRKLKNAL